MTIATLYFKIRCFVPAVKLSADVHFGGRRRWRHRAHEELVPAHAAFRRRVKVVKRKFAFLGNCRRGT